MASAYSRARDAYIRSPGRALLRLYLIQKAKRGKFDGRMFRYYGVDPKVNAGCRAAVVRAYAAGLVPTSTRRWPATRSGSYHTRRNPRGEGLGIDFGLIEAHIGTRYGLDKMIKFQRQEHWRYANKRHALRDMVELIGPDNRLIVLRDRQTDLSEGTDLEEQHDNHVHEAYFA